jgi:hypothetical protein
MPVRRVKRCAAARHRATGGVMGKSSSTGEAAELARRFLALWEEYLTALLADAAEAEPDPRLDDAAAGKPGAAPGPPAGAAPAAAAPREHDDVVAELARRLAGVEERVAAIEREQPAPRTRGRDRRLRG